MANFLVFDDDPATLDWAKQQLSSVAAGTEDEIRRATRIGCEVVEDACGPILATARTERIPAGAAGVLSVRASAVTAVAASGTPLVAADFVVDGQLLTRANGARWADVLTVSYTAGWVRDQIPEWAKAAALLIALQYRRSQLKAGPGRAVPEGSGFLVPHQAEELMAPHVLPNMGFA